MVDAIDGSRVGEVGHGFVADNINQPLGGEAVYHAGAHLAGARVAASAERFAPDFGAAGNLAGAEAAPVGEDRHQPVEGAPGGSLEGVVAEFIDNQGGVLHPDAHINVGRLCYNRSNHK
jgi:hypothetical protein